MPVPSPMEDYLFDLRGYLLLPGAVDADMVERLNAAIDAIPPLEPRAWYGNVHRQDHYANRGVNLQNIVEGGAPFEALIDHPSWIGHARRYIGDEGLFIDECFVNLRGPGECINIHSGGHARSIRTQFRYHDGRFHCGQINLLLALTDIGPGDGATVVIPGSHKSNLVHPALDRPYSEVVKEAPVDIEGAIEVYLNAGDAILFVDALCHGGAARVNPGERRILVYRYGPRWGNTRFGYQPSPELLERLTAEQRKIVQPIPPRFPPLASRQSG